MTGGLRPGNKNTECFHALASANHSINCIKTIYVGVSLYDRDSPSNAIVDFF